MQHRSTATTPHSHQLIQPTAAEASWAASRSCRTACSSGRRGRDLIEDLRGTGHESAVRFYDDPEHEAELADVREVALGATARVPDMPDTWEGWEDSAVPPERLGDYLRDLSKLYDEFGYAGAALYGHFGQGCVHTRIPFNLVKAEGIATFRRSSSGPQTWWCPTAGRSPASTATASPAVSCCPNVRRRACLSLRAAQGHLRPGQPDEPGKVVAPYRIDENLRLGASWSPRDYDSYFSYPDDDGRFERAVMRCVGVGKCRHSYGGVMCPSHMVTREEEHSTRGRSRLLFEMLEGHADSPVTAGRRSTEVRDALDLCLACKGHFAPVTCSFRASPVPTPRLNRRRSKDPQSRRPAR